MRSKCRQAVTEAALAVGRKAPTAAQFADIENRISSHMRQLAREDAARWKSLSPDQQLREGAASAMAEIKDAAARKLDNAKRQIMRVSETEARLQALQESYAGTKGHDGTRAEALKRDFELTHTTTAAERKIAQAGLMDLIQAAGDKKGAGIGRKFLMTMFDAENPTMSRDLVKEIFKNADGHTSNEVAKTGARAWLDTIESLRTRFNAAGGDVGRLDYGYTPQPHDTARVRKAGADAWIEATAPLLDRNRYLKDDGARMDDAELRTFLRGAYETLSTEGLNKTEPGQFQGTGNRANRGSDSRQIHFADGEAWSSYMTQFGKGSIYDAMMGHVSGMVRDIVLVERYGPDANANARLQFDLAARADGTRVGSLVDKMSINPETYWDMITGKVGAPADESLARTGEMLRGMQTAAKLGSAVISSVTDLGTLAVTTGYNRLGYWKLLRDIASQGTKETRDFMSAQGMIAESTAGALNRWSGEHLSANWSGKLSNATMRWSFLNAWTDGLRQGFTMSMNAGLARMAKTEWTSLAEFDRSRLTRAGLTADDWSVLNGVEPTTFKGRELLTPQTIKASGHERANEIAAKIFGFIHDESEFAVVNPDLATRAVSTFGGQQAGTWAGEIARTTMQFKSFPIAMMTRHWRRMLEGDHGADGAPLLANRYAYAMAMLATSVGLGAVATQEKQIISGKDPIDMHKGRFWAKALAQGGGLSILGDLFLIDPASSATDSATTAVKNLAGPTIGTATDLALKVISENIWQAAEGKDSHWEAELANWAKQQIPGNSLWWLRPMIEHGFTNAMNEKLSPGYAAKVEQKAMKDWNTRMWWRPGDGLPDRGPDLGKAVGQ